MGKEKNEKAERGAWFAGLKSEFSKIAWLDRPTLFKQVVAVIIVSVILGIIIAALDFGIQQGMDFLVNL